MTKARAVFAVVATLVRLTAPASAQSLPADPNGARLFFVPTARTLEQGRLQVSAQQIFLPSVQGGVTDRITIGGGTPLMPGFSGSRPFWATGKVQIVRTEKTQVAVGDVHIFVPGVEAVGFTYVVATRGTRDNAVTVGVARGYADLGGDGITVAMIGGEYRLSARRKLVAEGYLTRGGGMANAGIRLMRGRLTCDLGLGVVIAAGQSLPPFPLVNVAWTF